MKKTFFVLSAIFLLASPVLAGNWDEELYPDDLTLTHNPKSEGMQYVSDHQDMVKQERKSGLRGFIGGFVSRSLKVAEAPLTLVGSIFGRNQEKSGEAQPETPQLALQEAEPWAQLSLNETPDFSLTFKGQMGYSVFEKSEGDRLVNMSTSEKDGQENRMMKIQILLQDFVSTDEN